MKRNPEQLYQDQTASRRRARILIVAPSVDILGGQAVQAARLISRLESESIFEIGFLPINPRLPGFLRLLQAIKYVRTVVTSLLYVVTLCAQVRKYDVIHIFSASYFSFVLAQTPAILISKLLKKRVLLNYHSGEAADHFKRWPSAISTIRLADELIVPSEYLVKVFAEFGLRAKAIYNLIDLDDFPFRERKLLRPCFLTNRNLETHYGVDCVLRAFAKIQRTRPDASLTVAGAGSQSSSLQELAEELGLRNTVFVGRVEPNSIYAQYDAADIYLNGSRIDNQPLSILEAFACGIPVLTSDAGGIPDMVADGITGFVVPVDDHDWMAAKALSVLEKPEDTVRITRRAFDECQQYSWQSVGEQWSQVYQSLVSDHGFTAPSVSRSSIHRLSRMSFAEMRVRSSQLVKKIAERHGWSSSSRWLTDAELLRRFRRTSDQKQFHSVEQLCREFGSAPRPYFFSGVCDADTTTAVLRGHWPEAETRILEAANRIVAGKFDLLGWSDLSFGSPINWHLEPVSGKIAPLVHWSRVDYLNPEVCGDKKIIWELNRHQYFVTLGQAYWLTNDETYARCFAQHVESWMDANPPKQGINWASSLEIAFRSISWVWALHFFKNSPSLSSATLTSVLKCLYLNARHLEDYLSTYFSPNTHLTGEALGLFYLGTVLPEFNESRRWREAGARILVDQLRHQVRPDGVYFEQSSYYHRYTIDFYTHFLILSRVNGHSLPSTVEEKLRLLLDHLMYVRRPDGTTPLFGDEDGGRLIKFDSRSTNDFRAALSNGASLFKRGDYKFVAGEVSEETLWLLGEEGLRKFEETISQCPSDTSRAFPSGGYYLMRDSWKAQANYLLFDCGPHGTLNSGHAHADALAIQVAAGGVTVLEDAGTYTYTGSNTARDLFRGSAAHNVLLVDGQPSSIPDGPFSWKSTAGSTLNSWLSEKRFDFAEGTHDGYKSLPDPVDHKRSILFLKNDYWILRDQVTASDVHQLDLLFHFAPSFEVESTIPGRDGQPPLLSATSEGTGSAIFAAFGNGSWRREEGWISHCYGRRTGAPVWAYSAVSKGNTELVTVILPKSEARGETVAIRQVEAIGGKAFEISNGEHRDLVLIKDAAARRVQTVHLVSDFKWAWARFPLTTTELPEELVVIHGRTLELNGKEILMSARPINYLVASRLGNKFRLQTSEGSLDFSFPIANLDQLFVKSAQLQS
ncbi:MAG TPA: heparinase II/III family protein [Pyrinomonadaceae bacterium]|nr:heparinase II/III family protein [Pyrinomonadaceae bacterium]